MGANQDEGYYFIMYYLTDLFKKAENVFVTRKDFEQSVGELNLWVSPVGKEAESAWLVVFIISAAATMFANFVDLVYC